MRFGLLLAAVSMFTLANGALAQPDLTADHLDGTEPLVLDEPLDVVMVRGINYFAEREIADSPNRRPAKWNRDYSSVEAYETSVEPNRQRLREIIGAVDERVANPYEWTSFFDEITFANQASGFKPDLARWDVLEGVTGEGVSLMSLAFLKDGPDSTPLVILIPDADQTPEMLTGMAPGLPAEFQLGRRLAESGCDVIIPAILNRDHSQSGHPEIRYTNMTHREFVYRMGFEMGRHIVGYEVQKVLAAIDSRRTSDIAQGPRQTIAVVGIGEGALIAMTAAAIDPRIDACMACGYFDERELVWTQPIYRNIWSQLTEFGDAELAGLIAPRSLIVEACPVPEVSGPPAAVNGIANIAAPGKIENCDPASVNREWKLASGIYSELDVSDRIQLIVSDAPYAGSAEALTQFLKSIGLSELKPIGEYEDPKSNDEFIAARTVRQVRELVDYTQKLLNRSDKARDKRWANVDGASVEACITSLDAYRRDVYDNMIGRLPEPDMPLNVRTRKVLDEETHVGYEVMIDCYPTGDTERPIPEGANTAIPDTGSVDSIGWAVGKDWGVIAGGILLLPRDLKEGEQRPVVVCQHGLEGVPMDTITTDPAASGYGPYKGFSTQLVKRGFIVYAPQNPYRGHDAFRVIQRKSNPMGRSLFSYIIPQHQRTITWLASLPFVDRDRIAFYGLSYGGKTAVRVPPMLVPTDDTVGYCLSICSADFNEWVRKNTSSEDRYSYVYTGEYEIFEWNMGHVANYAELSYLMTPRPFMVERGHDDGVAPDEWVAWEFAKVKRHYDKLGIGDQTEMEVFNGPHTINGIGTFEFLHRHLNWRPDAVFKPL